MKVNFNYIVAFVFLLFCSCARNISSSNTKYAAGKPGKVAYSLLQGTIDSKTTLRLAAGKATPFNWAYHLIDSTGITIIWNEKVNTDLFPFARFRISTATDVREPCVFEIRLKESREKLGDSYARRPLHAHPGFYSLWVDGAADKLSESKLYFSNNKGNKIFAPPYNMEKDFLRPERVKFH